MRRNVDLAVLHFYAHQPWFDGFLDALAPAFTRIRQHDLNWEANVDLRSLEDAGQPVSLRTDVFVKCAVPLRRYDVCLLPITLETLGWTRQALASIPRGPFVPIVGLTVDLRSGALLDLLELGLADFVGVTTSPDELRTRLLCAASKAPRTPALRDATALNEPRITRQAPAQAPLVTGASHRPCKGCFPMISKLGWPDVGFGQSKQRMIELFERQYLQRALAQAHGNIASAARASQKDRRAFWELLRKHRLHTPQMTHEEGSNMAIDDGAGKIDTLKAQPETP
jgi:hypothetical protein